MANIGIGKTLKIEVDLNELKKAESALRGNRKNPSAIMDYLTSNPIKDRTITKTSIILAISFLSHDKIIDKDTPEPKIKKFLRVLISICSHKLIDEDILRAIIACTNLYKNEIRLIDKENKDISFSEKIEQGINHAKNIVMIQKEEENKR